MRGIAEPLPERLPRTLIEALDATGNRAEALVAERLLLQDDADAFVKTAEVCDKF